MQGRGRARKLPIDNFCTGCETGKGASLRTRVESEILQLELKCGVRAYCRVIAPMSDETLSCFTRLEVHHAHSDEFDALAFDKNRDIPGDIPFFLRESEAN